MRKSFRILTVLMPAVFILSACGMLSSDKNTENPEENTVAEEEPLVPYGYLIEDEEFVTKYKGFYIVRDGKFYSLNDIISCKNREEYNVGKQITLETHFFEDDVYAQSLLDVQLGSMGEHGNYVYYFTPLGDYDIIKLEPDDEIRSYGVSNVEITKLESLGYGFRREMCGDSGVGVNVDDEWEDAVASGWIETTEGRKYIPSRYKEQQYKVGDEVINLNYNLEKGTEVTVSWYEKTDYYEYTAVADTRFYYATSRDVNGVLGRTDIGPILKEGTLCKEGYATYDFSDLEPGLYFLRSTEIVEKDFGEKLFMGRGLFIVE